MERYDLKNEIGSLVQQFFSHDIVQRQEARQKLVKIGKPAIPYLVGLQYSPRRQACWEAIKTLSEIAHPDSIPILINALESEESNIRWLAAEGLIKIGRPSLMPVFEVLEERAGSKSVREAVHHILKGLKDRGEFTDDHDIIGMFDDPIRQVLLAPTAALISMGI